MIIKAWLKASISSPFLFHPLACGSTQRTVERVVLVVTFSGLRIPQLPPVANPGGRIVALRAFWQLALRLSSVGKPRSSL